MPNYSLVASSQFNPFSYQELLAPVQEMSNYHEKLADEYDKLSSQADILEAMGTDDRDKGSRTYNRFKAYSDALRAEADNLFRNGLNGSSRQRLSDLRRRYNQEIVPIQNAWNKRQEEADMQIKAQIQHPELRFTRDARSTSLEEYIANPAGGFGVVNLNNIAAQMSAMAQNLAKQINSGDISKEDIDEFTYNMITKRGFDPNFVSEWIRNPKVSPTLTNMMNQVLKTNGLRSEEFLNSPNGASILNEATGAAQMGAWSSVGETTVTPRDNFLERLKAENKAELDLYKAKKDVDAQAAAQSAKDSIAINPVNIYSQKEVKEKDSSLSNYSKYFSTDMFGNVTLNTQGVRAYNDKVTKGGTSRSTTGARTESYQDDSDFKKFVDKNLGKEVGNAIKNNDPKLYSIAGKAFKSYIDKYETYDATRSTEFNFRIYDSQQKDWKQAIQSAARGTKLQEVDFDKDSNTFKAGDDTMDMSELNDDKVVVLETRFSPYGNTVMIKDDNGEVHRYKMPTGLNYINENNRDKAIQEASEWQKIVVTGKYTDDNGQEKDASEAQVAFAEKKYKEALQNAYLYHSQLAGSNKTKEQEFNQYGY